MVLASLGLVGSRTGLFFVADLVEADPKDMSPSPVVVDGRGVD